METPSTMPVQIVQELLAIHTTRKEAAGRLNQPGTEPALSTSLSDAEGQSDKFITALMAELANYGDAVQSEVDRKNEYLTTYKEALSNIDGLSPEQRGELWEKLETGLRNFYGQLDAQPGELPDSLQELLTAQRNQLD